MIDKIIKDIVDNKLNNVHTTMICRVTRVNPLQIKPIHKRVLQDGSRVDYPLIDNPYKLGGWIYADDNGTSTIDKPITLPLSVGDKVIVIFNEYGLDNSDRKFNISDAIILGKLT